MDRTENRSLIWRLKEAGYGPLDRIYVRIGAEPSFSPYGTEDGTRKGKRRTATAYRNYRDKFTQTAEYLNVLNRRHGLNIHSVFAGASAEDFERYIPPASSFDALGYDLYLTPENKASVFKQLRILARRYPTKPLILPEFGIATEGPRSLWVKDAARIVAHPRWAREALADVMMELSRHPAGVQGITVFSVNVPARISDRRWNWAWTAAASTCGRCRCFTATAGAFPGA